MESVPVGSGVDAKRSISHGSKLVVMLAACSEVPRLNLNDSRSYARLLDRGIADVLAFGFPVSDDDGTSLDLVSTRTTRRAGVVTFRGRFQVRVVGARGKQRVVVDDEVKLGRVPLLTDRCTILIDGVEHAARARLAFPRRRRPGVVILRASDPPGQRAWFLPHVGPHVAIDLDGADPATVCIDNSPTRVPLAVFLQARGWSSPEWSGLPVGDRKRTRPAAVKEVARALRPHVTTSEEADEVMVDFFGDPGRIQLSPLGRLRIDYRLKVDEPIESQQLTERDLLAATRELVRVARGEVPPDPADAPRETEQYRFRTVGELVEEQLRIALVRMCVSLQVRELRKESLADLIPDTLVTDAVQTTVARYFTPVR